MRYRLWRSRPARTISRAAPHTSCPIVDVNYGSQWLSRVATPEPLLFEGWKNYEILDVFFIFELHLAINSGFGTRPRSVDFRSKLIVAKSKTARDCCR